MLIVKVCFIFIFLTPYNQAYPEQGKWDVVLTEKNSLFNLPNSLYANSQIFIQLTCDAEDSGLSISFQWTLTQYMCWQDYHIQSRLESILTLKNESSQVQSKTEAVCQKNTHIILEQVLFQDSIDGKVQRDVLNSPDAKSLANDPQQSKTQHPVIIIPKDGLYWLNLLAKPEKVLPGQNIAFNLTASVKILSEYGYLSAINWPLLPFYASMCGVYTTLSLIWLIVSWMQWRDLLRIQFWIGGVALLGMLESAAFYGVYAEVNSSGKPMHTALLLAEWMSVVKRALARMLVIIVSLGFGIVKPRLGPSLQRVAGAGALWGMLAALEAWLRLSRFRGPMPDSPDLQASSPNQASDLLLASAPLALLDSAICWWVFTLLANTTRTLRLRRNTVKLALYRHFTNTLIFAVVSSIIFMLYSIKRHQFVDCLTDWKQLWVDEAYWHILFASVLAVIMILWRPTNNNQRYAFTPLLDNPDDDDDEEEHFVSDAYGVKMRGMSVSSSTEALINTVSNVPLNNNSNSNSAQNEHDIHLRWVEDNIPAAALPVLDSDEEILNAKFEVSKMQ